MLSVNANYAAVSSGDCEAVQLVLGNVDLVHAILEHVRMHRVDVFVQMGRISKTFRSATRLDNSILMTAALSQPFLNKGTLCGLFGLLYAEADTLPRQVRTFPRGGREYMYTREGVTRAWELVGSMDEFAKRKQRDRNFASFYEQKRCEQRQLLGKRRRW